jgi:gliding motility-associated-like protein
MTHSGNYRCIITNQSSPYLKFEFYDIEYPNVEIKCIQLGQNAINVKYDDCNSGWMIVVDEDEIMSPSPVLFSLHSRTSEVSQTSENTFSRLFENAYTLRLADENVCTLDTLINQPLAPNCDEDLIFSPNNDGYYDEFQIEKGGEAKVYNRYGTLIKTFSAPGAWDGTDLSQSLVPDGYYIIVINGETSIRVAVKK